MSRFEDTFREAHALLGLHHYHVEFEGLDMGSEVADIAPDPPRCFAHCSYHPEALEKAGRTDAVAVHEACHLLVADLVHACKMGEQMAAIEEERLVMRLQDVVLRAMGKGSPPPLTPRPGHDSSPLGFSRGAVAHGDRCDGDELRPDHLPRE